jgi:hypothetical protein
MATVGWIVLALLLVVPRPAQTACAWVLWEKVKWDTFRQKGSTFETLWTLSEAVESRDECERLSTAAVRAKAHECDGDKCPGVLKVESEADAYVQVTFKPAPDEKASAAFYTYHCLPDTIDPGRSNSLRGGRRRTDGEAWQTLPPTPLEQHQRVGGSVEAGARRAGRRAAGAGRPRQRGQRRRRAASRRTAWGASSRSARRGRARDLRGGGVGW